MTADFAGKIAAPQAVAGADVIPLRPAVGVYLIIEDGQASAEELVDLPGVAGVWWYHGALAPAPYGTDARGRQMTYCYLDGDVLASADAIGEALRRRWASGAIAGLLAAPFYTVVPFEWARYLPGGSPG
jgi:hypothetical protein